MFPRIISAFCFTLKQDIIHPDPVVWKSIDCAYQSVTHSSFYSLILNQLREEIHPRRKDVKIKDGHWSSRDSMDCKRPFCKILPATSTSKLTLIVKTDSTKANSSSVDCRILSGVVGCPCEEGWNCIEVVAGVSAGPCLPAESSWPWLQGSGPHAFLSSTPTARTLALNNVPR